MTTTRTLCAARGRRAAILGLGLGLAILLPSTARSALNIIEVTDLVDDADTANGTCTLREAIRSANTNLAVDACRAGSATSIDRIHVLPGTHVVDLTSGNDEDMAVTGDLDILGPTVIQGSSAEFSIIEASGAGGDDRLFHIQESAEEVHFERVALRGGNADDTARRGGVLLNEESGALGVELVDVEVSGGTADLGGGIYNEGNLVIRRSRITGNHTTFPPGLEGSHGGGIHSTDVGAGAQLTIEDSSISGNQAAFGGGLYVDSGALVLHRLQLVENEAIDGGGLYVATNGYDIDYVEISRNSADRGAGMFMAEQGEVQHSAFIDNEASTAGGGLYDGFGGFVRFSTFSANSAPTGAAAYADSGQTLFDSDTISRNFGTGVHNQSGAFFENTIVSENLDGNCSGNAPGFGAFNIEDMDTCGFVASAGGPNFPNTTPQIGPLGYNGGPTPTLPLLPGSPAVDAVSSEIRMNCEKMLDQRGHPRGRPRSQNGQGEDVYLCDIGAFEQTAPFVVDSLTDAVDADPEDDLCLTATGACTLRAAIQQANALPGLSEIELGAGAHVLSRTLRRPETSTSTRRC
jgi:CSLREA domain-containing protein